MEKQVRRLNRKAMAAYDTLDFDTAKKALLDAVALLRKSGLDSTPVAAKTYLNLGVVYISGLKDPQRGLEYFATALKLDPNIRLDPQLASPELEEAFQSAEAEMAARQPPAGARAEPVKGLEHVPVDKTRPLGAILIRAQLGSDLGATRLILFYRSAPGDDFVFVPMTPSDRGEWSATIPAEAVTGTRVEYYLEARDARRRPVARSASPEHPHQIAVVTSPPPAPAVSEVEVEDPQMRERLLLRRAEEDARISGRQHLFLFVMPGFGLGYEPSGNHTEVAWQLQQGGGNARYQREPVGSGGLAISYFHIAVEAGVLLHRAFSLSAVGRLQLITGASAETVRSPGGVQDPSSRSTTAFAGLMRARYRFLSGGRFHPYLHVNAGYGQIRHALDVSAADLPSQPLVDQTTALAYNRNQPLATPQRVCADRSSCIDTILLGSFLVGGGAGLWYDLATRLSVIVDLNLLGAIGTGKGQSGMNLDVQIGFGVRFL